MICATWTLLTPDWTIHRSTLIPTTCVHLLTRSLSLSSPFSPCRFLSLGYGPHFFFSSLSPHFVSNFSLLLLKLPTTHKVHVKREREREREREKESENPSSSIQFNPLLILTGKSGNGGHTLKICRFLAYPGRRS